MKLMFFDLENTLIQHWTDRSLCWIPSNQKFIEECQADVYGVFSYALWCDENIAEFTNSGMRNQLERLYGIQFQDDLIIHTNEVIAASTKMREGVSRNDEKYYGFMEWCEVHQDGNRLSPFDEVWLVDDTIDDGVNDDLRFKIVFRNPVVIQSFV